MKEERKLVFETKERDSDYTEEERRKFGIGKEENRKYTGELKVYDIAVKRIIDYSVKGIKARTHLEAAEIAESILISNFEEEDEYSEEVYFEEKYKEDDKIKIVFCDAEYNAYAIDHRRPFISEEERKQIKEAIKTIDKMRERIKEVAVCESDTKNSR